VLTAMKLPALADHRDEPLHVHGAMRVAILERAVGETVDP